LCFLSQEKVIEWAAHGWGTFNLKQAGITLEVVGKENLDKRPAILVVNHQSMLDLFIMCALRPPKTLPVSKKSMRYIPLLGLFMKSAGVIFIDRYNPKKAMAAMKETYEVVQKKGYSILMAPEGTRTKTGELSPLKKGAFYLALQTKLPMIPITLVNAFQLFPKSAWSPKPGSIQVFIDSPILTETWTEENLSFQIDNVRRIFLTHLSRTL